MKYSHAETVVAAPDSALLFIHNGPRLAVIVAGGLRLSRPHSYLTLGPASSSGSFTKTHCGSVALTAASVFQVRWPRRWPPQPVPAPKQRPLGAVALRGRAAVRLLSGCHRPTQPAGSDDWTMCCESVFLSAPCVTAESGEEVADEHLLHGRVSRQLSAVGVVGLVRVLADVWTGG